MRNAKVIRDEKGLSLEKVAQAIGVNKSTLSRFENGLPMKYDNIKALARFYEISDEELVAEAEPEPEKAPA